ncbi:SMP-30/gluconolactonase/LRE family protein, partial [Pantoea dispersa]|uniref:SMP-30/gluconolactonase/LRE family protein n=1 Tax=Pantoea dispersa TaxID=59814 RepID=UPI000A92EF92
WYKLTDASRLRMADDLDIAPDGKIYFSDCTTRYEMTTNTLDILEGRPNGRVVCYDPATKTTRTVINHFYFPNGICVSHDGKSILIASTSLCKVFRHWIDGPNKGKTEVLMDELPVTPDNINRASDVTYWLAVVGIRTPTFDLAARKPGFRLRMGQAGADRRMAGARAEPWLRAEVQREGRGAGIVVGSDRHLAFDLDLDARAPGLSLSRRPREQPDRPHQARRRRRQLDRLRRLLGRQKQGDDIM